MSEDNYGDKETASVGGHSVDTDEDSGEAREAGHDLYAQNRSAKAEAAYREAIDLEPDNALYYNHLGDALFVQERYGEAEAAYREAVRLDPDSAFYHDDLGRSLFAQEKYAEAEAAYREAARLNPGSARYFHHLGNALLRQERYPEAEAAYGEAVRLDPDSAVYHDGLGRSLFAQEKYAEAEAAYREAARLNPGSARYFHHLGNALLRQERYPEAEAAYREAVRLDPDNALYSGDLREAQAALQQRISPHPVNIESGFGVLRLGINGSWSVEAFAQLLTHVEQAYFAAAALESLTEPWRIGSSTVTKPREQTAEELLQAVVAFRLGGGLRIRALHYGSAGFIEVIGALNPLKTVKDGITENREINRKREETRLFDERERKKQSAKHKQTMEQARRREEQMRLDHDREMIKLQIEAEKARAEALLSVIDRLEPDQRTAAAASLFQMLTQNVEGIANDARLTEVKMLETREPAER